MLFIKIIIVDSFVEFRTKALLLIRWKDEDLRDLGPKLDGRDMSLKDCCKGQEVATCLVINEEVLPIGAWLNDRGSINEERKK